MARKPKVSEKKKRSIRPLASMSWGRLWDIYTNEEEWTSYAEMYGLHTRLGFSDPHEAWIRNPEVAGSCDPRDYRVIKR